MEFYTVDDTNKQKNNAKWKSCPTVKTLLKYMFKEKNDPDLPSQTTQKRGSHDRDPMVIAFTTTCVISAYHH